MRVEVTAEDIAKGHRQEEQCCPIWYAIRRALTPLYVGGVYIGVIHCEVASRRRGYGRRHVRWPAGVRPRIRKYDRTGVMEPFTFELPDSVRELVASY